MISLSPPILGEEEKRALCEVIDSGWLTMGERVVTFEKAFAKLHGLEDAVAVNSCTAALHLSLRALGIGPGDEVLVPSLTFVATVNAVLYIGAMPVFVDIETKETPHISIYDAKDKLTPKTRAVIVMHYGGYLVDLKAWRDFADENRMHLIEDAAHAPATGSVGRLSNAATFSFFSNKNMSTAEGGMILSTDASVLDSVRRLRAHGMSTDTLSRHRGHAYSYDVSMLGYNYRMDELRAAIGFVQLSHLKDWNQKRRNLTQLYRQILSSQTPELIVPFNETHDTSAHLLPVLLPKNTNRLKIIDKLREAGIQSSIHYPPIHQFSFYKENFPGIRLPMTEEFCFRELTLPLHPSMHESDVQYIVDTLKKSLS